MAPLPPLLLRRWERTALCVLEVVPLPGLGALLAGWRNPHTPLRRNGAIQLTLFILGAYPLIVPGAAALAWAGWDCWRMAKARLRPLPPKEPEGGAPAAIRSK